MGRKGRGPWLGDIDVEGSRLEVYAFYGLGVPAVEVVWRKDGSQTTWRLDELEGVDHSWHTVAHALLERFEARRNKALTIGSRVKATPLNRVGVVYALAQLSDGSGTLYVVLFDKPYKLKKCGHRVTCGVFSREKLEPEDSW